MSKEISHIFQIDELDKLIKFQERIKDIVHRIGYTEEFYQLVKDSLRTLKVRIPVRMDDGSIKVFTGFRSQHNDAVGPTIGGVRLHPKVTETDIKTAAFWMTLKTSLMDLPLGGAMGGIICDPRELSFREIESLSRGYIRAIGPFMKAHQDILTPDFLTTSQIMAWMLDEYHQMDPHFAREVVTGKPFVLGGIEDRNEIRAKSIIAYIKQAAQLKNISLNRAKIIVQGFGQVGSFIAKHLYDLGAKVIGISDAYGAIYDETGLDINYLYDRRDSFGTITKLFDQTISNQQLLEQNCDILIPAAVSGQITKQNAHNIRAKIIVEAVNHSVTQEAYDILYKRNIFLVPDLLTATGHPMLTYFEWLQNKRHERFSKAKVDQMITEYVTKAFQNVYNMSTNRKVNTKEATYIVALQRLAEVIRFRGWM